MGRPRIRWTPALLDEVRRHAALGHTLTGTAASIGVSRSALQVHAANHHIDFRLRHRRGGVTPPGDAHQAATELADEIAAARAEAATAPPYRDPSAWPR